MEVGPRITERSIQLTTDSTGFYTGYEYTKRSFQKSLNVKELPVWATLTSGAVGGIAYWTAWCAPPSTLTSLPADL